MLFFNKNRWKAQNSIVGSKIAILELKNDTQNNQFLDKITDLEIIIQQIRNIC